MVVQSVANWVQVLRPVSNMSGVQLNRPFVPVSPTYPNTTWSWDRLWGQSLKQDKIIRNLNPCVLYNKQLYNPPSYSLLVHQHTDECF